MESIFSPKIWKVLLIKFYFRKQEFLVENSVDKLMHMHKVIHLVGTYSHPEAVKKLQL